MTAFLRMGNPVILDVSPAPTSVSAAVPATANSIRFVNPNLFDVRVRGATDANDLVTATTGLRILAGGTEVFSTQAPSLPFLSCMSVDSAITGTPAGTGKLEAQFGTGE